jgi:hypothetical protein
MGERLFFNLNMVKMQYPRILLILTLSKLLFFVSYPFKLLMPMSMSVVRFPVSVPVPVSVLVPVSVPNPVSVRVLTSVLVRVISSVRVPVSVSVPANVIVPVNVSPC